MQPDKQFTEAEIQRILALPPDRQAPEIYKLISEILRDVDGRSLPGFRRMVRRIEDPEGIIIPGAVDLIDGHIALRRILGHSP